MLNRKLSANPDLETAVLMPFSKVNDNTKFSCHKILTLQRPNKRFCRETLDIWKKITLAPHCGGVKNDMKKM